MQVLDEQFLKEGFKVKKTARMKFSLEDTKEGSIQCEIINGNDKVVFECLDDPSGTKVCIPNLTQQLIFPHVSQFYVWCTLHVQVIPINSVDIWKRDYDELKMDIEQLLYPPCFSVIANPPPQNDPGFVQLYFKTSEGKDFYINCPITVQTTSGEPTKA